MSVPLAEQIRAVKREISLRVAVYPKRVMIGRMRQADADREIAAMRGVLETLEAADKRTQQQPELL